MKHHILMVELHAIVAFKTGSDNFERVVDLLKMFQYVWQLSCSMNAVAPTI